VLGDGSVQFVTMTNVADLELLQNLAIRNDGNPATVTGN
jgi:hypothetical protein